MKKIALICLALSLVLPQAAFAAGGGAMAGDRSSSVLFTGSASDHFLLLSSGGVVTAWGSNSYGQCGAAPSETADYTEIVFEKAGKITQVAAGGDFSLAVDQDGRVWGWGNNNAAQLGFTGPADSPGYPSMFTKPQLCGYDAKAIAAGDRFCVILDGDGAVYTTGDRSAGRKKVDFPDSDGSPIVMISARDTYIMAASEAGSVYAWNFGESPGLLDSGREVLGIAAGSQHGVYAVRNGGAAEVYGFGDNTSYQLGTEDPSAGGKKPYLSLTIPDIEGQQIALHAGDRHNIVDVFGEIDAGSLISEYVFGTGCFYADSAYDDYAAFEEGFAENVLKIPERRMVNHMVIAVGKQKTMAYRFDDAVEQFGPDAVPEVKPILEPDTPFEVMYEYQYAAAPYKTVQVNFINIHPENFPAEKVDDSGTEKYSHWEYVDAHTFQVKAGYFAAGTGPGSWSPMFNIIQLSGNCTNENRRVGIIGQQLWNFNRSSDRFQSVQVQTVPHGAEDGTSITVQATTRFNYDVSDLEIPETVQCCSKNPNPITADTPLGLYVYGLPEGTGAEITGISGNRLTISLKGNSAADLDYDAPVKLCYVYVKGRQEAGGKVGDYDLYETVMCASETEVQDFAVTALENTPETMTVTAESQITLGQESGRVLYAEITGGTFSKTLNPANWTLDGCEERVTVSAAERVDATHAKLTLAGKSGSVYTSRHVTVTCTGEEYTDSREYDEGRGIYVSVPLTAAEPVTFMRQRRGSGSSGISGIPSNPGRVSAVQVEPKAGAVVRGTRVALSTADQGAEIYYTLDGSVPTEKSSRYTAPIEITADVTIRAAAVKPGMENSQTAAFAYTIRPAEISLKKNAAEVKYLKPYADRTVRPDQAASRYEILEALQLLFDVEDTGLGTDFPDVDAAHAALAKRFSGAGILEGYPDGSFQGNQGITRAEFVKLLGIMLGLDPRAEHAEFSDTEGHWAEGYISSFAGRKYLLGYPDGTFRPDQMMTRAEMVTVLNRITGAVPAADAEARYADVPADCWAFADIMAAVQ